MVSLKFHDFFWGKKRYLEVFATNGDYYTDEEKEEIIESEGGLERIQKICIKIYDINGDYEWVNLDKATAIKLSKELRKQIALLD